jgi:putative flavoprotein involved in K+ transport
MLRRPPATRIVEATGLPGRLRRSTIHEERAMTAGSEYVDTLIIGAGQAGLAAGYHLAHRGLPFRIVDADARIGDHWRDRWDSLRLFSPARVDGLPGMRFPLPGAAYPTGREMGDYLETYAERFHLPVESGIRVDRLLRGQSGSGFVAVASGRRIAADQVIVATGPFRAPHVPELASRLDPRIHQLHAGDYRNPGQLQPGPVLVVGLSHSGADIAFETAATHRTILSGKPHGQLPFAVIDTKWRARLLLPIVNFVGSHVLTMRTPIGRMMAPEVRKGGGPLLRVRLPDLDRVGVERHEARTVDVRDGKPVLDDGRLLDVANVIWCTGYRPDYGWIEPSITGDDGWPMQERGVTPIAGLYVLGVPFTYAFTSMLVGGAGRDARFVVDRLQERRDRSMERGMAEAVDGAGSGQAGRSRSAGPT